ncbi:DUF1788 domain-containing protein [Vampirovibrio sp.]|uniref:DUF1788 domain-containing protein n=1 Tax=Vampirovibrio sp. TaxID=2717857 RepID=UPI003593A7C0
MTVGIEKTPLQDRFNHLFSVISGERFLQKQGLGNEIPFFICWFKPEEAVEMERLQKQLIKRLEQHGVGILDVNLYDLAIELLTKRGVWEQALEQEQSFSKDQLKELLQGILDPEAHLVPAITHKMNDIPFDVMFLSGIGEVFPYIRSHNVLNNLQKIAKEKPTVMFYPGFFQHSMESGASLDLFGRLHEDKYYRAFDIYHCEA